MTKTWEVMNDLEVSFSQITSFSFMLDQLQEAVNKNDYNAIVDITASLNAFYPVYCNNWDKKFKVAWEHIVK